MCITKLFKKLLIFVFILTIPISLYADANAGAEIYKKKCSGCHGIDGNTPAYGISRKLTELDTSELRDKLKYYTSRVIIESKGVTAVMGKQTAKLNSTEYKDVLDYITSVFAIDRAK